MIRKGTLFFILLLSFVSLTKGQELNIREKVYLHLNSRFLLTGETLYFSAYNRSMSTGQPSGLSKILYVELVDSARNQVFQQKIALENGKGHGQFFISSLVATGHYQLLAYTRWMKNFGDYFESTITIVNPFEAYKPPVQPKDAQTLVSFYPEGGLLLAEKENTIVYKITNLAGEPVKMTGRVISQSGEQVSQLSGEKSIGRFTFQPKPSEKYQVILEDEAGNFSFYELPEVAETGQLIHLSKDARGYRFEIVDSAPAAREVSLRIHDGQNMVFDQLIYTNGAIQIRGDKLRPGSYRASVVGESGKELASRAFIHYQESPAPTLSEIPAHKTRSLVKIPISFERAADFSVSVRKTDSWNQSYTAEQHQYANSYSSSMQLSSADWQHLDNLALISEWKWDQSISTPKTVEYLPELRGELVSGRLNTKDPQEQTLSYTISGKEYHLYTEKPDTSGEFQFQINPSMGSREAYISVLFSEEISREAITLDNPFLENYPVFSPESLYLDSLQVARLVKRSVRNQIENAYYETRPDSIVTSTNWFSPFGAFDYFYVMDDYNRFPEMHEHFIEYIPMVVARKSKSRSKLKVLLKYLTQDEYPPLILLDGVPVSIEKILDFNPYKVESIGVFNSRYFIGPLVVDGIVSFHTFEKNLQGFEIGDNALKLPYQGVEPGIQYRFPEYETQEQKLSRIPDYREQLYWEPEAGASPQSPYQLEFYTGDTTGEFEVVMEGYYEDGEAFSLKKTFKVEEEKISAN